MHGLLIVLQLQLWFGRGSVPDVWRLRQQHQHVTLAGMSVKMHMHPMILAQGQNTQNGDQRHHNGQRGGGINAGPVLHHVADALENRDHGDQGRGHKEERRNHQRNACRHRVGRKGRRR